MYQLCSLYPRRPSPSSFLAIFRPPSSVRECLRAPGGRTSRSTSSFQRLCRACTTSLKARFENDQNLAESYARVCVCVFVLVVLWVEKPDNKPLDNSNSSCFAAATTTGVFAGLSCAPRLLPGRTSNYVLFGFCTGRGGDGEGVNCTQDSGAT